MINLRTRRRLLKTLAVSTIAPVLLDGHTAHATVSQEGSLHHFRLVQMDVFTSERLRGNPLSVFTDARGLSDSEMQDLAHETNLQETTFVFPRDSAVEAEDGVNVRIFTPEHELPFGGHPTLGTAIVLRSLRLAPGVVTAKDASESTIVLNLKVGKVPVSFREDPDGLFGEMKQMSPVFGRVHDRGVVAETLGLSADEIEPDLPVQTISTGLPYTIVPIKHLNTLHSLQFDLRKAYSYLKREENEMTGFYFVTRDTSDPKVRLRARAVFPKDEDPATGLAAGCTSAWMVKYGVAQTDESVLILQGVEVKRPSKLFVRSSRTGESISNVRVGGHAVKVMEGEASL